MQPTNGGDTLPRNPRAVTAAVWLFVTLLAAGILASMDLVPILQGEPNGPPGGPPEQRGASFILASLLTIVGGIPSLAMALSAYRATRRGTHTGYRLAVAVICLSIAALLSALWFLWQIF